MTGETPVWTPVSLSTLTYKAVSVVGETTCLLDIKSQEIHFEWVIGADQVTQYGEHYIIAQMDVDSLPRLDFKNDVTIFDVTNLRFFPLELRDVVDEYFMWRHVDRERSVYDDYFA